MSMVTANVPMSTSAPSLYDGYGANRNVLGQTFTPNAIAAEDWLRAEQSAHNDYLRQLDLMNQSNAFNASQAELQRAFERDMSNTAFQRGVSDMKKAGINPIMMYANHSASTPQGVSASNTASGTSFGRGQRSNAGELAASGALSFLIDLAALGVSLYTKKPPKKTVIKGFGS